MPKKKTERFFKSFIFIYFLSATQIFVLLSSFFCPSWCCNFLLVWLPCANMQTNNLLQAFHSFEIERYAELKHSDSAQFTASAYYEWSMVGMTHDYCYHLSVVCRHVRRSLAAALGPELRTVYDGLAPKGPYKKNSGEVGYISYRYQPF